MEPENAIAYITQEDLLNEGTVAEQIEKQWGGKVHKFPMFTPIDFWIEKDRRVVAVAELKTREVTTAAYDTIWLSVAKWLSLTLAATSLQVKALFIVKFIDETRYVPIGEIDSTRVGIGRNSVRGKETEEPVIHVPVKSMRKLNEQRQTPQ